MKLYIKPKYSKIRSEFSMDWINLFKKFINKNIKGIDVSLLIA